MPEKQRTAIVTGAAGGIGRAMVGALLGAGLKVAAVDRTADGLTALAEAARERQQGANLLTIEADLAQDESIDKIVAAARARFGTIDILVNNAGVTRDGLFRRMDREAWDEVINTNLNSVFEITQHFIEAMAGRGWGRVINISSIVGRIGNFGQANYAAAKAGLIGLTKTLAREYARKGVTVNAIAPGFVKTRMLDGVPDKALQTVLDTTPVGRLGDPMEIGASVLYLASPSASFVTGHVLDVNGGMAM
jgi:3-oxoacyl-[acyl-carrier protein] reductase